jgi:hypothetical protein
MRVFDARHMVRGSHAAWRVHTRVRLRDAYVLAIVVAVVEALSLVARAAWG